MKDKLVWRGVVEICSELNMSWQTAKKELRRLKCLRYVNNRPVVYVEQYRNAILKDCEDNKMR